MATKMRYFNVDEYNRHKRQQGFRVPPEANFLAAASHMRDIFEAKKLAYGFMGGFAMLCLGNRRAMPDLHIAYDDRDFAKIKSKLEADQRIRLPDGMNPLFPSKILVRTGSAYGDKNCTDAADIEVDLIPPGAHGAPPMGMLSSNLVLLTLKSDGKPKMFKGLNMLHLIKTLVHYCRVPDLAWNPQKDILFLCQNYGANIQAVQRQLDKRSVQQNFLTTAFFSRLPTENRRGCYLILLGQEPPPTMALTPPPPHEGHRHSHSASEVPRQRISSHKSSPQLNQHSASELQSLPLPGKLAPSPNTSRTTGSRPVELSATPKPPSELPASATLATELPAPAKDSRSRYRPISAPSSRNNSPQGSGPLSGQRSISMDMRYQPQQPAIAMNQGFQGQIQPFAFSQAPLIHGVSPVPPPFQQFRGIPVEMSATPAPYNPGQQYMKSQLGLGGNYLNPESRGHNQPPITNNPVPPKSRNMQQGPQRATVEQAGAPGIQSQKGSLHVVNPDFPTASSQQPALNLDEVTGRLSLDNAKEMQHSTHKTKASAQNKVSGMRAEAPQVFELDTPNIVAELSANIDAALKMNQGIQSPPRGSFNEPQRSQLHNMSTLDDSPVSPPDALTTLSTTYPQSGELNESLAHHDHSAPQPVLPASLMVGGQTSRHQSNRPLSNAFSSSPPRSGLVEATITKTNASRYSSCFPLPSSAANSHHIAPQLDPAYTSQYKAYQLPGRPLFSSESQQPMATSVEQRSRPSSSGALKSTDNAQLYLQTHERDASPDSHISSGSHDSARLALEYQAEFMSPGQALQ